MEILAFYMDCVGELGVLMRLWCRNFHCTWGICREIGILQGFWWRTWYFNVALVRKFL